MDLKLKGKVALVLGAGGGLGSAIAEALAREGAKVAACDVNSEALKIINDRLEAIGAEHVCIALDLNKPEDFQSHIRHIENALGPVSVLVNNSGGPPPSTASGVDAAVWRKQFDAMVLSLITLTDLVLPQMRAQGWGRIITSTSSGVVAPIPNLAISNALRLSLVGWSKTLAREVAVDGITVNVVLPGRIATSRIEQLDHAKAQREGRSVEDVALESTQSIPVQRYGRPEEYGNVVAFLASDCASYINGSVVRVDGGLITSI